MRCRKDPGKRGRAKKCNLKQQTAAVETAVLIFQNTETMRARRWLRRHAHRWCAPVRRAAVASAAHLPPAFPQPRLLSHCLLQLPYVNSQDGVGRQTLTHLLVGLRNHTLKGPLCGIPRWAHVLNAMAQRSVVGLLPLC